MKNSKFWEFLKKNTASVLVLGGIVVIAIAAMIIVNNAEKEENPSGHVDLNESAANGGQDDAHLSAEQPEENEEAAINAGSGENGGTGTGMNSGEGELTAELETPADDTTTAEQEAPVAEDVKTAEDGTPAEDEKTAEDETAADDRNTAETVTPAEEQTAQAPSADSRPETETADGKEENGDAVETSGTTVIENPAELSQDAKIAALSYDESMGLAWPLLGDVVMNYSDDHLIYHATLNQFRTHPAVAIAAEQGSLVTAAADAVVTAVEENVQTGVTVTMAIGNDYYLVYGQLADCSLQPGDSIKAGEVIGTVSEVSRFYSLEGDNLYFQVLCGEESVNPMSLFPEIETANETLTD